MKGKIEKLQIVKGELRLATLSKDRLWERCLHVNFAKCSITLFYRTPTGYCFGYFLIMIFVYLSIAVSSQNSYSACPKIEINSIMVF